MPENPYANNNIGSDFRNLGNMINNYKFNNLQKTKS